MKKLGLIGGTGPESTIEYYKGITGGVQQRVGRPYFPRLTIESLSVFDVLGYCEKKDYSGLTQYLLSGFQSLAAAGAECAALTGCTELPLLFRNMDLPVPYLDVMQIHIETLIQTIVDGD